MKAKHHLLPVPRATRQDFLPVPLTMQNLLPVQSATGKDLLPVPPAAKQVLPPVPPATRQELSPVTSATSKDHRDCSTQDQDSACHEVEDKKYVQNQSSLPPKTPSTSGDQMVRNIGGRNSMQNKGPELLAGTSSTLKDSEVANTQGLTVSPCEVEKRSGIQCKKSHCHQRQIESQKVICRLENPMARVVLVCVEFKEVIYKLNDSVVYQ